MISMFSWFVIVYICAGTYIMMDALVDSWYWEEFHVTTKILGGIVCILLWPLAFFMN